ncbi:MAG: hypothetical protein MJ107_02865 [Lachnospiraceae bacterium]|nr:hypothetical protein [Lachnospiraceae bacterium]
MNNKKISKIAYFLGLMVLALLPFYRVFFGVDFTDTGYSIANFMNFTDKRGFWSLSTYLANFAGFIFTRLPFGRTLVGIRFYCTLVVVALVVYLYVKLSRIFNSIPVFVGLLISILMTWCPFVVLYNYLSYLLTAVILILLYEALNDGKECKFFVAGLLLGANVFVRFSNLTVAILIIPVAICTLQNFDKKKLGILLRRTGLSVGGFATGFAAMFVMTGITHGFGSFFKMLDTLSSLSNADYGYSYKDMLLTLPYEIMGYGKWIPIVVLLILCAYMATIMLKHYKLNRWIGLAFSLTTATAVLVILRYMSYWSVFTVHDYNSYLSVSVFALIAVLGTGLASIVSLIKQKNVFFAISVLCLIFIIPLGTNTGLLAYQNFMFIIVPTGFGIFMNLVGDGLNNGTEAEEGIGRRTPLWDIIKMVTPINAAVGLLLLVALFQSGLFYKTFCYASASNTELTASFDKGVLKGTKALPGMVTIVSGLDDYIEDAGIRNKKVITWGDIPLMGFALDMQDAISTGWPDLTSYRAESFTAEIAKLDSDLPIIIVNKWYSGGNPLDEAVWPYSKKAEILAGFMQEHSYKQSFENDKFLVYRAD